MQIATSRLLEETGTLKSKLAASERRSGLVSEFLGSYQLSEAEVQALADGEVRFLCKSIVKGSPPAARYAPSCNLPCL